MLKTLGIQPIIFLMLLLQASSADLAGQGSSVKIIKTDKSWKLEVNGRPFYIKGVVGDEYLSKVKENGGNSIRTGWQKKELDELEVEIKQVNVDQNLEVNSLFKKRENIWID